MVSCCRRVALAMAPMLWARVTSLARAAKQQHGALHLPDHFCKILAPHVLHVRNELVVAGINIVVRLLQHLQQRKVLRCQFQLLLRNLLLEPAAFGQRQPVASAHDCSKRFAVCFGSTDVIQTAELGHSSARVPLHVEGRDAGQPQHLHAVSSNARRRSK